jgi:hypothetical protein
MRAASKRIGNGDICRISTSQAMLYGNLRGPSGQREIKRDQLYSWKILNQADETKTLASMVHFTFASPRVSLRRSFLLSRRGSPFGPIHPFENPSRKPLSLSLS